MLFSYAAVKNKYGNEYQIKKAISSGELFKIENGVYSDNKVVPKIAVIAFKYPNAIFTSESAFFIIL